jgi:hypothetical protein
MQGLLYGVRPERWEAPDRGNKLLRGLARVPMAMRELAQPRPQGTAGSWPGPG